MTKIRLSDYHRGTILKSGYEPLRTVGEIDPGDIMAPLDRAPRQRNDESIVHLGEDIKARGQLQPIRVYWSSLHSKWVIIAGERRWLAIQAAGLWKVSAIFLDHEPSTAEILSERLADNLLRENPEPMEIARGFRALMDLKGWNASEVADHLHIHRSTVSRALALLKLPEEVQQHVESGELAPATAYELSKVKDEDTQKRLAERAVTETMTRAETAIEAAATGAKDEKRKASPKVSRRTYHAKNGITVSVSSNRKITDAAEIAALQERIDQLKRSEDRDAA